MNQLKRPGDLDLGLGEPPWGVDDDLVEDALEAIRRHGTAYGPNAGLADVRAMLVAARGGRALKGTGAEGALLTVGAQEAVACAMGALVEAAGQAEVLLIGPCYPSYRRIAEWLGLPCRTVTMSAAEGFALDPERILAALGPRTRLVILGQPGNPTGQALRGNELEILLDGLARHPARPWLLSDEVYRDLPGTHTEVATALDHGERVVVVGSLSKSHAATGWRIGWLLAPPALVTVATRLHQLIVTSTAIPGQRLLEAVCRRNAWSRGVAAARQRWEAAAVALTASGLEHTVPNGGFFTLVRPPAGLPGEDERVARDLLDHERIVTIPGAAFGADGWLRISLLAPSDRLENGLGRLARYLDHLANARA